MIGFILERRWVMKKTVLLVVIAIVLAMPAVASALQCLN
jgi:hypothetical protein